MSLWLASLRIEAMRACVFGYALRVFARFLLPFLRRDLARSNRLEFL